MREEKEDVVELKVDEAVSRVSHFAGIGRVNIKDRRRKLAKVQTTQRALLPQIFFFAENQMCSVGKSVVAVA